MTSHGSLVGQLQRAIDARQIQKASMIATELERVPLRSAMEICFLMADAGDSRYEAAATRLLQRFATEKRAGLHQVVMAAAALAELGKDPSSSPAHEIIRQLVVGT